jgi:hypothetical protein
MVPEAGIELLFVVGTPIEKSYGQDCHIYWTPKPL